MEDTDPAEHPDIKRAERLIDGRIDPLSQRLLEKYARDLQKARYQRPA